MRTDRAGHGCCSLPGSFHRHRLPLHSKTKLAANYPLLSSYHAKVRVEPRVAFHKAVEHRADARQHCEVSPAVAGVWVHRWRIDLPEPVLLQSVYWPRNVTFV